MSRVPICVWVPITPPSRPFRYQLQLVSHQRESPQLLVVLSLSFEVLQQIIGILNGHHRGATNLRPIRFTLSHHLDVCTLFPSRPITWRVESMAKPCPSVGYLLLVQEMIA